METRQLTLDEAIIPEQVLGPLGQKLKTFDPEKKICHGIPMRKVELSSSKFAYKCDECLILMVREK